MAKGKSSNSAKSESASRSKRTAPAKEGRGASPASKADDGAQRGISSDEIGHVAGEIWGLLHSNGDQTIAAVKKSVDAPADLVLAAIGWLAREGKLTFSTNLRPMKISLR